MLLAAALGLVSLTVVGGGFEIARRAGQPFLRASWRAVAGLPDLLRRMRSDLINLTDSSPVQERYAVRRGPRPTDPVQDLKVSLSELMGDLRRATAASDPLDHSLRPLVKCTNARQIRIRFSLKLALGSVATKGARAESCSGAYS